MTDSSAALAARVGPVVDSNVHLWDQDRNAVFWLTDRTMVRDMLGDYDSLPDRYTVADYRLATSAFDVRGLVWSDAGAADPVAAAEWVAAQGSAAEIVGLVGLADITDPRFEQVVQALGNQPLVTSVRIRLVPALLSAGAGSTTGAGDRLVEAVTLLSELGLVVTIEAPASQLPTVADCARRVPGAWIVLDHFGWPQDRSDAGRRTHLRSLGPVAEQPQVVTRIDAIGTIFGDWETETIRPWLTSVVDLFGPARCLLGSDLPIETLRSSFESLYAAYDTVFDAHSDDDRRQLFAETARRVYGQRTAGTG